MFLPKIAIEKRVVTYFTVVLLVVGGIGSFFSLGQLEDPEFTVKTALVSTNYPGASAEEVELEVTDRLELAIQDMKQIDYLESFSRAGRSQIWVNIKPTYKSDALPQIWDELRRKVSDTTDSLPPGVAKPKVVDDFGDVFGLLLAVTGDGFSYADLEYYLWGVQDKIVYLDVSQTQLTQLGLSQESIESTLHQQNLVVDAGSLDVQDRRFRINPTGQFTKPGDIADLPIRPSLLDSLQAGNQPQSGRQSELIRIRDIGDIREAYRDPPASMMRFNSLPALALAISNQPGVNVVKMGQAVDQRLDELLEELPIGIEIHRVHWQSDVVDESVKGFFINLAEAVAIVLAVLAVAMGWRMGLIIGGALVMTILGTFMVMALFGIDLQRMSLGALVIALGMMVDNAIVVAEGYVVRLQKGMGQVEAAIESASQPAWPLLGATVVAVMAFFPIYVSPESAGEYCATLFSVVGVALMISWVISVTVTPLQCLQLLPVPKAGADAPDPYGSRFYGAFRGLLSGAIRARWLTIGGVLGLLALSVVGFGRVDQLFFPDSAMTKFMVDYWMPEGTRVQQVSDDVRSIEDFLLDDPRVEEVATFVGAGPPRFYLPVEPESNNAAYAQLIVNVADYREIDGLIAELDPWLKENYPSALVPVRKFGVGPATTWKFQARISGPAVADPGVLRSVGDEVIDILRANPTVAAYQTDWRQRVMQVVPEYNQERARWAGVTREDIAAGTKQAFDGRQIGLYREGDDLIPIVLRYVEEERRAVGGLDVLQIQPAQSVETVPLSQVTDGVVTRWEDPVIWRRDRRSTITVEANPIAGVTLPSLLAQVQTVVESVELPVGYRLEWGGEKEDSEAAQQSLIPGIVPAAIIILFIMVALFNAIRPPLIIVLTIPFVLIGITAGLLAFGAPFGFVALLGAMSLAGMMIKNAIVLLDEINLNLAGGMARYEAVVFSAVSRLRPVVLAAATTVLGVIPLLQDVFWVGMAITIMAGLTFGTLLTMILVPVLYIVIFRVKPET
jgi:multidrug efflux pump subunit AcrB